MLQAIFLGGETPMTLELLLELPIFADVKLKNQEAIPTKVGDFYFFQFKDFVHILLRKLTSFVFLFENR